MSDTLQFATFNHSEVVAPSRCGLCGVNPAAFEYYLTSERQTVETLHGQSCLVCAMRLLRVAEYLQVLEWSELVLR